MLLKLFVFLIVSTTVLTLGQVQNDPETICPPADLLSPYCKCSKGCDLCPATVECSDVLNFGDLEAVFRNTPDWTFWHFSIVRSSFPYIPANAIVEKRVRNLYLRNNTMYTMFDEPPASTNLLQELELTDLRLLRGVSWDVYSTLEHLKEINLTNFKILKIDQEFVHHFPQGLTGLYFRETRTKRLGDDAFANLANLTRLFIRDTQISELKRSMFPPVSKLIAMHFSGNQISSLPDDLFTNMPDLRGVDFSNTNVVTLPESVFGRIMPQLGVLYLEGNAVNCNCEMKWIPKLKVLPYYARVECTRPKELEGFTLKKLKEAHFVHCE
ncbi:hypothetical protein JTE90_002989 [Oedothorax gibbosus]|uniref:Uncharacterized protein n=1 Tax=Oedothorax gibbosus TaxID=931172 RepID=A0AAV6VI14_9ARAC|nr:hypothetical protein JTE90_002989 [Oedothorax gibbosus]